MEIDFKVTGVRDVARVLNNVVPRDPKRQRQLLNQSMSAAAKKTIIPLAQSLALQGDGSGALSAAIKPRAVSLSRSLAMGKAAVVDITPVRHDPQALALYASFYDDIDVYTSGLRHGHLIEFGFTHKFSGQQFQGRPFLLPATDARKSAYVSQFSRSLRRKVELEVRKQRRRSTR